MFANLFHLFSSCSFFLVILFFLHHSFTILIFRYRFSLRWSFPFIVFFCVIYFF